MNKASNLEIIQKREIERLNSVGISIDLPINFTSSADLNRIDFAINQLKYYKSISNSDVVILYHLLRGPGVIQDFYRLYSERKAKELIKQKNNNYGNPITLDWLIKRKEGIMNNEYIIRNNKIRGYRTPTYQHNVR